MDLPPPAAEPGWAVSRVAAVRLRGPAGPLQGRLYWPAPAPSPSVGRGGLLVFFPAGDALGGGSQATDGLCRELCSRVGVVVLAAAYRRPPDASPAAAFDDASAATHWAADHAVELGADPGRLLVGGEGFGGGLAAAVALEARRQGWPPLSYQVLIRPRLAGLAAPSGSVAGAAPATVVSGGVGSGSSDDGRRHAARLRRAGVAVDELRYVDLAVGRQRMVGDLARSLRQALRPMDSGADDLGDDLGDVRWPS